MANSKKKILSTVENTGFSTNVQQKTARFLNKDGSPNVKMRGIPPLQQFSFYHYLINVSGWKFFLIVFAFYTTINFLFACIYYFFAMDHLIGAIADTPLKQFEEAYFFSAQTLTTVGYGRISPLGFLANAVASLEALIGIMTLAIITGLVYGRFVKPKAYIRFSHSAVIAPFKNGKALMIRIVPIKKTSLTDLYINITASILMDTDGKKTYRYINLPLQFNTINSLYLSWTIVHPINEESPLFESTTQSLIADDLELIIYLRAYDENFNNTVIARSSYTAHEIVFDARFVPMFSEAENGTILSIDKLNDYQLLETNDLAKN